MNELTSMLSNVQIDELEPILLQIIEYDFNKLRDFFINRETDFCIESEPIYEYYLNPYRNLARINGIFFISLLNRFSFIG